jgi:hypothetical protein
MGAPGAAVDDRVSSRPRSSTQRSEREVTKTMAKSAARKTRTAVIAGVAVGVLSLGVAGTALATSGSEGPSTQSAHTSAQKADGNDAAVETVSDFYDGYITARGEGDEKKAEELRDSNVTAKYAKKLAAWEKKHDADGVVRSQNVPVNADVTYDGSGMGHSWTVVTLTWDGGKKTKLHVQSDIESQKISGIKDKR